MGDGGWFVTDADGEGCLIGPYATREEAQARADEEDGLFVGRERLMTADDFPPPSYLTDLTMLWETHEEDREEGMSMEALGATREEDAALADDLAETWRRWVERVLARHGRKATVVDCAAAGEEGR